jgi:hypothetical protein
MLVNTHASNDLDDSSVRAQRDLVQRSVARAAEIWIAAACSYIEGNRRSARMIALLSRQMLF